MTPNITQQISFSKKFSRILAVCQICLHIQQIKYIFWRFFLTADVSPSEAHLNWWVNRRLIIKTIARKSNLSAWFGTWWQTLRNNNMSSKKNSIFRLHMFCRPRKAHERVSREKPCLCVAGARCWSPPVYFHQTTIFLFRYLCPCWRSYIATVQSGCWTPTRVWAVTIPVHIPFEIDMDSHSRVDEGVIAGSCKITSMLFDNDLLLLASPEQGHQHALDRFFVAYDQLRMKISSRTNKELFLFRKPNQCIRHLQLHSR